MNQGIDDYMLVMFGFWTNFDLSSSKIKGQDQSPRAVIIKQSTIT